MFTVVPILAVLKPLTELMDSFKQPIYSAHITCSCHYTYTHTHVEPPGSSGTFCSFAKRRNYGFFVF